MSLPGLRRVAAAWAGVDRYRRLNFAVLSCLAVMFGLVISLVLAVRTVDDRSASGLAESRMYEQSSREFADAAAVLERFRIGAAGSDTELAVTLDQLGFRLDDLGASADAGTVDTVELIVYRVGLLVDDESDRSSLITTIDDTIRRLESLSEDFAASANTEVVNVEGDLDGWFFWIQVVAAIASVVFLIVVFSAILPLSRSIERSLLRLQTWRERATRETARRTLTVQVSDGLDVADTEDGAYAVLARAMATAAPDHRAELLLADSSKAHLRPVVVHPERGAPGCGVMSPWSCPAVRRGSTMVFDDSEAIRSCPHLADRAEPCSAVCSPLTFMGQPMGVLHATGPVGEEPPKELVEDLTVVAAEAATRIGTLRAFAKAELQASTDVLTGLPNRRSTEERMREIVADIDGGSIALVELEGLVDLNDRLGKAAGDRAVTVVADALQLAGRPGDFIGRWAGTEFVVVFAEHTAAEASTIARRMAGEAEAALDRAELVGVRVLSGVADTRLADSVRDLLQVANDSLGFARRATLRRRSSAAASAT